MITSYTIQFAGNILKQNYIFRNVFVGILLTLIRFFFQRKGNSYEQVTCSGV